MADSQADLVRNIRRMAIILSCTAVLIAASALIGWYMNAPAMFVLIPGLSPMKLNTSASLLLCGLAILLKAIRTPYRFTRYAANMFSGIVFLICALILYQHFVDPDLNIDKLLLMGLNRQAPGPYQNRMAISSATCLISLSIAIIMLDRTIRVSQVLAIISSLISMLALLCYAYSIESLYTMRFYTTMAFNTALTIFMLSLAVLMSRPRRSFHYVLISTTSGGTMARRLLPATILLPLFLGWLPLKGYQAGFFKPEFAMAIFALIVIAVLAVMVWQNSIAIDTTERNRKKIESDRDLLLVSEKEARRKAEQTINTRDQMLFTICHELRNPLTPVLLITSSLEKRNDAPADMTEDIRVISEQVKVESRLINDLLDLASLGKQKVVLKRHTLEIGALLNRMRDLFTRLFEEKKVRLIITQPPQSTCINADSFRIEQVMRNLLVNALKFTPENGQVEMRCRLTHDNHVAIDIQDSGIGISPEVMSRIFNAFEQGEQKITRRYGGLGIGLAVARELIQLHGGTITAASQGTGFGATFTITLPTCAPEQAAEQPVSGPAHHELPIGMRILIVEDNTETLRALERLLGMQGYRVSVATSAEAALMSIEQQHVDLIISDIGLPDMSGWDLLRKIREKSQVKAIAFSGFVSDQDRQKSKDAGFAEHLSKPIDIGVLTRTMSAVMSSDPANQVQLNGTLTAAS